jgi:hypothetical protein
MYNQPLTPPLFPPASGRHEPAGALRSLLQRRKKALAGSRRPLAGGNREG